MFEAFRCKVCPEIFKTKERVTAHLKNAHGLEPLNPAENVTTVNKTPRGTKRNTQRWLVIACLAFAAMAVSRLRSNIRCSCGNGQTCTQDARHPSKWIVRAVQVSQLHTQVRVQDCNDVPATSLLMQRVGAAQERVQEFPVEGR